MTQAAAYAVEDDMGLHPEQDYVMDIASEMGIEARLVEHDEPTVTCQEKADLLGWPVERVVKAVYFRKKKSVVGIVTPELGQIPHVEILSQVLGIEPEVAAKYTTQQYTPTGMDIGTCTPFPLKSIVGKEKGKEISHIIVVDHPPVRDETVDISVGGSGYDGQMISMHIPYGGIHDILLEMFGPDVVRKYSEEK